MTDADKAKAKAIVDTWYWQPDSWRRTSFVRFYESAPMASDVFKLVLDYLKSETATSIVMAGKLIELGETWKATDAWYQTMPAEKWQGTESTKIRVYQAFRAESDTSGGPYTVENGCQYAVTHKFFWDVAEIPAVPASSSGVSYSLQGVVRDKDTGLYSCVLECRTRVQLDVSLYRTGGTVFDEVQEEQHLGVKAQNVASTGLATSAANGIIVTRKIQKNPDCTSDVINTKTTEISKPNAIVVTERTLRGTRTTVTNRNQNAALPTTGLAVGERRTSRLTDGGCYDTETSQLTAEAAGKVGEECGKTKFEHEHVETDNQAADPGALDAPAPANGIVIRKSVRRTDEGSYDVTTRTTTENPVENAVVVFRKTLRGTVVSRTHRSAAAALDSANMAVGETRRSEVTPGGLHNNTVEQTSPEAPGRIGESCEKQIHVHAHSVQSVVASEPTPIERAPGVGQVLRRQVQKNDLGSYEVTDTATDYSERSAAASGGTALSPTALIVTHDARSAAPTSSPGVNRDVNIDLSPTERGTFTKRQVVTTHNPSGVSISIGAQNARVSLAVQRNQTSANVQSTPAVNRTVDASLTINEHGSFDKVERITDFSPAVATAMSSWATEIASTITTRHDTNRNAVASQGTASAEPDDNGAATTRTTEYTPVPFDSGWITWSSTQKSASGTYHFRLGLRVFCNLSKPPTPPGGTQCSVNAHVNKFGLYDGSITYSELIDWTQATGGGGGSGGSAAGRATFYQYKTDAQGKTWRRSVTVPTRVYYGYGNEGSRAAAVASQVNVAGLTLGGGAVATGAPTEGAWMVNE